MRVTTTFDVFEDIEDGVELKADAEDDEDAVAEDVTDLIRMQSLDHDPDPHHHAPETLTNESLRHHI